MNYGTSMNTQYTKVLHLHAFTWLVMSEYVLRVFSLSNGDDQ